MKNETTNTDEIFEYALEIFRRISKIPRGSGNTKNASAFCVDFAVKNSLENFCDEVGNVIIRVPASEGYEKYSPVAIRGHLDMVAIRNENCKVDIVKDGIELFEDDEYIKAVGSSLGGDDGIAIACGLALAKFRNEFSHPAFELVFTVDEETGMEGAKVLDASKLNSKMLINVDSEEEGTLLVSCAGGVRANSEILFEYECEKNCICLHIYDFDGGHSGTEIDKGNRNAIKTVAELANVDGIRISSINGGSADNAIPSECSVVFSASKTAVELILARFE